MSSITNGNSERNDSERMHALVAYGLGLAAGQTYPQRALDELVAREDGTFDELLARLAIDIEFGDFEPSGLYYWAGQNDVDVFCIDAAVALFFPDDWARRSETYASIRESIVDEYDIDVWA